MSLIASRNAETSKLLKEITSSPKRVSKYRKAYKTLLENETCKLSGEDALASLIGAQLSGHQ